MNEYLCLTILSSPGESAAAFRTRLSTFWTVVLRTIPDQYEAVYSESKSEEISNGCLTKQYMIESEAVSEIHALLKLHNFKALPIDHDDTYNKAEASSSEWFQIPH